MKDLGKNMISLKDNTLKKEKLKTDINNLYEEFNNIKNKCPISDLTEKDINKVKKIQNSINKKMEQLKKLTDKINKQLESF